MSATACRPFCLPGLIFIVQPPHDFLTAGRDSRNLTTKIGEAAGANGHTLLEEQDLVLGRTQRGALGERREQRRAMASQQGQKTQRALLQAVVRVERIGELPVVCVEDAAAEILGAARFAPQANELVEHLPLGGVERTQRGLVEPPQRPPQPSEKPPDGFFVDVKPPSQGFREKLPLEPSPKVLPASQDIAELEA